MGVIEIGGSPLLQPTICGPVSDFKELTLASNATTLGNMGFVAGVFMSVMFLIGWYWIGPRIFEYGLQRGWWL